MLPGVLRPTAVRPALAYASEPVRLTGGFWAELLAFALTDPPPRWPRELVARIMPDAGVARKETILQAALSAARYPTPAGPASNRPGHQLGPALLNLGPAQGAPPP